MKVRKGDDLIDDSSSILFRCVVDVERRQVDEEYLPFEENSLEAVVSSLSLNWVNDLPGKQSDPYPK